MSNFIAALPMYDWPERRAEVDAQWARLRDALWAEGVDAPQDLVRRNAGLPAAPGGIRDSDGEVIAPDPASLPSDDLDLHTLWRHPNLLFAQTCWGPMELGMARHVRVIGQPSYEGFEGGQGAHYSSAILMRRGDPVPAPADGDPVIPLDLLGGKRLAFNSADSMSGIIALTRDLAAAGDSLDIFSGRVQTGGHRESIVAVAEGRADVCAIDCRTWGIARRHEPAAAGLQAVGWTGRRKGLPYITAASTPDGVAAKLRAVLENRPADPV